MRMKTFLWEAREFGIRAAVSIQLISLVKWFTGAKRIRLMYK